MDETNTVIVILTEALEKKRKKKQANDFMIELGSDLAKLNEKV